MNIAIIIMLFLVLGIFCSYFFFPYISDKYTFLRLSIMTRRMANKYKKQNDIDTYDKLIDTSNMLYKSFKERGLWDRPSNK